MVDTVRSGRSGLATYCADPIRLWMDRPQLTACCVTRRCKFGAHQSLGCAVQRVSGPRQSDHASRHRSQVDPIGSWRRSKKWMMDWTESSIFSDIYEGRDTLGHTGFEFPSEASGNTEQFRLWQEASSEPVRLVRSMICISVAMSRMARSVFLASNWKLPALRPRPTHATQKRPSGLTITSRQPTGDKVEPGAVNRMARPREGIGRH